MELLLKQLCCCSFAQKLPLKLFKIVSFCLIHGFACLFVLFFKTSVPLIARTFFFHFHMHGKEKQQ